MMLFFAYIQLKLKNRHYVLFNNIKPPIKLSQ